MKHGRIAMLAALGQITQYYVRLGDSVFSQVSANDVHLLALFFIIRFYNNSILRPEIRRLFTELLILVIAFVLLHLKIFLVTYRYPS